MAIQLPERTQSSTESMTPRQIVAELDKHVIGQHKAKRAVAIALRNRMRRQKLPKELADDVAPKNILMIGPTGVGKTEIARRLADVASLRADPELARFVAWVRAKPPDFHAPTRRARRER